MFNSIKFLGLGGGGGGVGGESEPLVGKHNLLGSMQMITQGGNQY